MKHKRAESSKAFETKSAPSGLAQHDDQGRAENVKKPTLYAQGLVPDARVQVRERLKDAVARMDICAYLYVYI